MIKGVIFDMDGTVVDVPYDWTRIKSDLEVHGRPILSYLRSLEEPERSRKWKILEKYEAEATRQAVLKEGIRELFAFLETKRIKRVLVTNNSRRNVRLLLKRFHLIFDLVVSRESGLWKPSGAPFLFVLKTLQLEREECCVVGDSRFDVHAALEAGIDAVFLLGGTESPDYGPNVVVCRSVAELQEKLEALT
ncbi:MAG: HAD family hydrolase [Candidatus Aminicenantales bacterium]